VAEDSAKQPARILGPDWQHHGYGQVGARAHRLDRPALLSRPRRAGNNRCSQISAGRVRVPCERRGSIGHDRCVQLHSGLEGPLEFSERLPPFNCPRLTATHWTTLRLRPRARPVATACAAQRQQRQRHRPVLGSASFMVGRSHAVSSARRNRRRGGLCRPLRSIRRIVLSMSIKSSRSPRLTPAGARCENRPSAGLAGRMLRA
jgi:hypothetical protein